MRIFYYQERDEGVERWYQTDEGNCYAQTVIVVLLFHVPYFSQINATQPVSNVGVIVIIREAAKKWFF